MLYEVKQPLASRVCDLVICETLDTPIETQFRARGGDWSRTRHYRRRHDHYVGNESSSSTT